MLLSVLLYCALFCLWAQPNAECGAEQHHPRRAQRGILPRGVPLGTVWHTKGACPLLHPFEGCSSLSPQSCVRGWRKGVEPWRNLGFQLILALGSRKSSALLVGWGVWGVNTLACFHQPLLLLLCANIPMKCVGTSTTRALSVTSAY